MSWFWTILLLTFAFSCNSSSSEAHEKHHKKSSSAVVVGTVYCDTCFQKDNPKSSHFIPGATVAVECKDNSNPSFRQQVQTDIHGKFQVHLPFHVSKHLRKIEGCSVKLISSNKPYCSIAATAATSSLNLKSRKQGTHIFSAGFFTFKPAVCDQKPIINNNKLSPFPINPNDPAAFPPPLRDPPPTDPPALGTLLPPLPQLPPLPRLPPLPGLPFLPPKHKPSGLPDNNNLVDQPDQFPFPPNPLNPFPPNPLNPFPPNPLNPPSLFPPNPLNPPSLLPPNPFLPPPSLIPPLLPTPPPSLLPPLIPLPPTPPMFQLPPIPGLKPLTPPPPPPLLPGIPLPPFPFQPSPGFPGVPPAEVTLPAKTNSP